MALNFVVTEKKELTPRITVFGVGGAGGNAVNNMIDKNLEGVEFVVANTDAQALQQSRARHRIQLGIKVTEGLGAGARPEVGASAAAETLEEIVDHLAGAHMCFITAGMGGGTGTGAAPIIAQAARDLGVLTVGVVTKPFAFEGAKRMKAADLGVEELQKVVDTLIVIPNQNLFRLANERTTCTEAFALADDVLYQGVKGVTDLMVRPGMINLDFADVRAVMDEMGKAMMGTGEAAGEDRAREAAEKAIANPLLDEISLNGAKGVLINITGGSDLTLYELDEAANLIREKVDPEANIIVGSTLDLSMEGSIRVSVVATGIEASADAHALDVQRRRLSEPLAQAPRHVEVAAQPAYVPQPEPEVALFDDHEHQAAHAPVHQPVHQPMHQPEAQPLQRTLQRQPAFELRRSPAPTQTRAEPVQDEFDLDEVLGAEDLPPVRHTIRVPAQNTTAPMRAPVEQQRTAQPEQHLREPAQQSYAPPPPRRVPGQPSPEVLERLNKAVFNRPAPDRSTMADPRAHQPHPAPQPDRGRLGGALGGLLGRMTGARDDASHAAPRPVPRPAPQMDTHYDDAPEQRPLLDRSEVPAFLRRQAN